MQHIDNRQVMALTNLEINRVMRGRDFQDAGAEFRIDCLIGDNRNFLACQGTPRMFTQEIGVSLVTWMKCHRSVGHDGFGSCSCDFQETPRLLHNLVADEVEVPLLWLGNHFFIRHRSLGSRIPVDHAATAINQPFPIKIDKNVLYSRNVSVIERIALARPVAGAA